MTSGHRLDRSARKHTVRMRIAPMAAICLALIGVVLARQPKSLAARSAARSAEPTFAEDVAPILYKNCTTCHHPGGMGPFSLLDFDSAKAKVSEMRDAVAEGQMPPWHAEGPRGVFRNDRRLSDADKQTILRWIDADAKPGDLNRLPPKPEYPDSWAIGSPDAIVAMQEDFVVPASGTVEYQYIAVPTNFTEDKWVEAMEIMPGAREAVHHVLVYAKVPPAPGAATLTPAPRPVGAPAPLPLFIRNPAHVPRNDSSCFTCTKTGLGTLIGTAVPGNNVVEFPKGTALLLRAGTVLGFQMHYTSHGHEMKDRTKIGFRFAKQAPEEQIFASNFTNASFTIPAGAKDAAVPAEVGVREPVRIWGLMPHTHLRGTRWQYKLEKPDGTSEVVLDVPHYDFNWQTYYMFDKPLDVPAGGKLTSMAWYDNSVSNTHNPDATKDVRWGDQTWEEMQYTGFLYSLPSRRLKPAGGSR
ncbi:MAG: cytochrome c [bacterium]